MNLKKLAILLGITTLCSLANAKAVIKVNNAQSLDSSVDTADVQANNDQNSSQGIGVTLTSGHVSISSSGGGTKTTNTNTGTTKVVMNGNHQDASSVNVNIP